MMTLAKQLLDFTHNHLLPSLGFDSSDREYKKLLRVIHSPATAPRPCRNMEIMDGIGIILGDLHTGNVAHGSFLDFCAADKKPHPCLDTAVIEVRAQHPAV